ncbi:MAG: thermonuclease family protein [Oceanicaulis sp.]
MAQVYVFSRKCRRRAQVRRRVRDLALLGGLAVVLAQPEVRSHIGSTAEAFTGAGRGSAIECTAVRVIDGDTLDCAGVRIRLTGIDAPELPGHCREGRRCVDGDPYAARTALQRFAAQGLTCTPDGADSYGRTLARCEADGRDAACALLAAGHAERRYGRISCLGRG